MPSKRQIQIQAGLFKTNSHYLVKFGGEELKIISLNFLGRSDMRNTKQNTNTVQMSHIWGMFVQRIEKTGLKVSRQVWEEKTQLPDWLAPDQPTQSSEYNKYKSRHFNIHKYKSHNKYKSKCHTKYKSRGPLVGYWLELIWPTQSQERIKMKE